MTSFSTKEPILLVIEGNPVPWAAHQGSGRRSFNPRYKEREAIQWKLKQLYKGKVISSPVAIEYEFYFPIPISYPVWKKRAIIDGKYFHVIRPDGTNCEKFIEDCLKGIVIVDDSQVYKFSVLKDWATDDVPKTKIKITVTEQGEYGQKDQKD